MDKALEIFNNLVINTLNRLYQFAVEFGPKIALSLVILLIGWLFAILLKKIVSKLLKALGFDVFSKKTGLKSFLENGNIKKNPSLMVGLVFYWAIMLSALIMIFDVLDLEVASGLIRQIIFYMPKIIVVLLLLTLGIFLGSFIGRLVRASSYLANIPFYIALDRVTRYAIFGLAVMISLEYLGIPKAIITQSFIIVFGVIPLVVSLIFLIGGRNIISDILASRFLMNIYKKGEIIEFDSVSGQVKTVGLIATILKNGENEIVIPNSELAKKITKKIQKEVRG